MRVKSFDYFQRCNVLLYFLVGCAKAAIVEEKTAAYFDDGFSQITALQSNNQKFTIYRDAIKRECYVELVSETTQKSNPVRQPDSRILLLGNIKIASTDPIYKELDQDVLDFCKNYSMFILEDEFSNRKSRRGKRQTIQQKKPYFKGQTQTQFISFNNEGKDDKGGIAEATAEQDKSRATVQGRVGMGQAQSQSGNGDPCDECAGSSRSSGIYGSGYPGTFYPGQRSNIPQRVDGSSQQEVNVPGQYGSSLYPPSQPQSGSGNQYPFGATPGYSPSGGVQSLGGQNQPATGTYRSSSDERPGTSEIQASLGAGSTNSQGSTGGYPSTPNGAGGYSPGQQYGPSPTGPLGSDGVQGGASTYPQGYGQPGYAPQGIGAGLSPAGGLQSAGQSSYGPQAGLAGGGQSGIGSSTSGGSPYIPQGYTPTAGIGPGGIQGKGAPAGGFQSGGQPSYVPQAGLTIGSQPRTGEASYLPQQGYTPTAGIESGRTQGQGTSAGGLQSGGQPSYGLQTGPTTGSQPGTGESPYLPQQGYTPTTGIESGYVPQSGAGVGGSQGSSYYPQTLGYTPGSGSGPGSQGSGVSQGHGSYPQQGYIPHAGGTYPQPGYPAQVNPQQSSYFPQGGVTASPHNPQLTYGPQSGVGNAGYPSQGVVSNYPQSIDQTLQRANSQLGGQSRSDLVAGGGTYPQSGVTTVPGGGSYPQSGAGTYPLPGATGIPRGGTYPQPSAGTYPQSGAAVGPGGGIYPQSGTTAVPGSGGYPQPGVPGGGIYPQSGAAAGLGGGIYPPSSAGTYPQSGTTGVPGGGAFPGSGSGTYPQSGAAAGAGGGGYPQPGAAAGPGGGTYPQSGAGTYLQFGNTEAPGGGAFPGSGSGTYPQSGATGIPGGGAYPQPGAAVRSGGGTYPQLGAGGGYYPHPGTATTPQGGTYPQGIVAPQPSGSQYSPGTAFAPQSTPIAQTNANYPGYYPYIPGGQNLSGAETNTNQIQGGSKGVDVSFGSQITPIDTASGESQSLSSLNINPNGTNAAASAQGKTRNGMAQAQVSGTYTGSFSAQAQTSDNEKSVQTQIFGNTTAASSSSQGKAGKSESQSQIQYNYNTGATLAESQGSGINYNTNTQIQAGNRGGIADAQSTGSGSTSSQAQIGFLPPDAKRKEQIALFEGGGTSSSQNSASSGQSQTQLQGSFRSGTSFIGSAQSSSGKVQNKTKLAFDSSDLSIPIDDTTKPPPSPAAEQSAKQVKKENGIVKSTVPLSSLPQNDQKDYSKQTVSNSEPRPQYQDAAIKSQKYDAYIDRDSSGMQTFFNAGDLVPGTNDYRIPTGFRGKVASTAGDTTHATATSLGHAQSQTVLLKPGKGRVVVNNRHRSDQSNLQNDANSPSDKRNAYDEYVTVTKSETGELSGDKKFTHTYYTKSSTCGYFTFTCNYVDGSNGRTKICKPGPLTYSDGTPCS